MLCNSNEQDEPQLAALCLDCIDKYEKKLKFFFISVARLIIAHFRNTAAAVSAESFLEVDQNTLHAVLERDTLRIKELCLFQAVIKWASSECLRQDIEPTPENQRFVLGPALNCIRFPLIPVEDFSLHVAELGLLTETELVHLYLNFTITSTHMYV